MLLRDPGGRGFLSVLRRRAGRTRAPAQVMLGVFLPPCRLRLHILSKLRTEPSHRPPSPVLVVRPPERRIHDVLRRSGIKGKNPHPLTHSSFQVWENFSKVPRDDDSAIPWLGMTSVLVGFPHSLLRR